MGKHENYSNQSLLGGDSPSNANAKHNQSSDEDSCSLASSSKSSASRLGRRGDPRMHKAVAARLATPSLSLIEALRIGGFDYPMGDDYDDHFILENDTVSLGQRKNQLSRRCRLAKEKVEGVSPKPKRKNKRKQQQMENADQVTSAPTTRGQKRAHSLDLAGEESTQTNATQRKAKDFAEFHQIIVPPPHVSLGTLSADHTSSEATWPAPAPLSSTQPNGITSSSLESLFHHKPHASGVAVASLNATASSVGMTLEQLAVSLASSTTLSKVLEENIPDVKEQLALNLFRSECAALYSRCMQLAGYSPEEAQANSNTYKEFAYKAWSMEGKRLESQVGCMEPPSLPPTSLADDGDEEEEERVSEKVSAASPSHENGETCSHHGDTCKKDDGCGKCIGGRHVHRLDGKCGHKAIIHNPEGGSPHVDFVVDGKVECYQGIAPSGPCAMWPSRYNCEQLHCPPDSLPHKVCCRHERVLSLLYHSRFFDSIFSTVCFSFTPLLCVAILRLRRK